MKKILAIIFVLAICAVTVFGFAACTDKDTLKIGVTVFKPMNYYIEGTSEWTGFETEFARAAAEIMGYKNVEFVEIIWENKVTELQSGNIDLVWNAMTIKDDLKENMDISIPYMHNNQVAVIRKSDAAKYTSLASMSAAKLGAEANSAGESAIQATNELKNAPYTAMQAQSNVLIELMSGTIDVGFIDLTMASASIGEGTSYADLTMIDNNGAYLMIGDDEQYGVGAKKGDPIINELNEAIRTMYNKGTLQQIAEKYGLLEALMEIK